MRRLVVAAVVAAGLLMPVVHAPSASAAAPCGTASTGCVYLTPNTCQGVWINDQLWFYSVLTASVHFEVDNICNVFNSYGYYVLTTQLGNPYTWASHYNNTLFYLWCGYQGVSENWIAGQTNIAWASSRVAVFITTPWIKAGCNPLFVTHDDMALDIYAGGYGPWNPVQVLGTSNNWFGPAFPYLS